MNSTPEIARPDTAQKEKAYALLESLADQLSTLQSTENRARVGSNLAASLWPHDEKRARTLIVSVENDVRTGLQNADSDDPSDIATRMVFLQLRVDTVQRMAKYDAEFALAFFRATEPVSDKPRDPRFAATERELELTLAKQVAAENPEVALKLARQALTRGFAYDLPSILVTLHRKNKDMAQVLYKEIVAKLGEAQSSSKPDFLDLALRLVRVFKPPQADELTFRELVRNLITIALNNGCGNKMDADDERAGYCYQIGSLLPQMEKVDPGRAARLRRWASSDNDGAMDWDGYLIELGSMQQEGTAEDILNLAAKYPQQSGHIYWQAVAKALAGDDWEKARKIAGDFNGNPEFRQQMLNEIDQRQKDAATNEQRLANIERTLNTIPKTPERIEFLLAAANRAGVNDRKSSLKLLDQAAPLIDSVKPGAEQMRMQVALAMMYCTENSNRGIDIMESLLPRLNELISSAIKLDGYETNNVREGEWDMSMSGSVGSLLTILAQNAGYFAWCDFDRAVSLTGQFERPEIRIMAQLKLAQSILAGRPNRLPMRIPNPGRFYGSRDSFIVN